MRRNIEQIGLGLALIGWLGGCGGTSVSGIPKDEPIVEEEHRIGGILAKDYYRQFVYRKVDEDLPFKYLSNSFTKLKKIDAKNNLYFNASLFLLDDGKYVLDYQEVQGETGTDGIITIKNVFSKRFRGAWKVVVTTLEVEGVGKAVGFTYNEKEVLNLTFDRAFNAPELKDKPDYFYYTSSNTGMPDNR